MSGWPCLGDRPQRASEADMLADTVGRHKIQEIVMLLALLSLVMRV